MVLKQKKYAVPSGTTFRKGSRSYRSKYLRQATLVKSVRNADSDTDSSEEDFHPDIEYSLNKKGRWNLPTEIKQQIDESEETICLRQFHKIKRTAKCISYESNKGPVRKMVPKKFYCDVGTVEPKKVSKSKSAEGEEIEVVNDSVEYVYSVYLPAGSKSAITYNPKYIDVPVYAQGEDGHVHTAISRKGRATKQRTGRYRGDAWDTDEQDDYDSEWEDDVIDSAVDDNRAENAIDGYIDVALQKKECKNYEDCRQPEVKTPKPTGISVKDRKIYIDAPFTPQKPILPATTLPEKLPETVNVTLRSVRMTPKHLRDMYGLNYAEAGTIPRRFVINITEYLTQDADGVTAFLSFEEDSLYVDSYYVWLRMSPPMTSEVPLKGKKSIEDLIEAVVYTHMPGAKYKPPGEEVKQQLLNSEQKHATQLEAASNPLISHPVTFSHIKQACGWSVESKSHLQITVPSKQPEIRETVSETSAQLEVCEVCYSDELRKLCMTSCGHVFCELCWTSYVTNALKNGVTKVTCPGYKCAEELSDGLIQSLVEPGLFKAHMTARMDNFLAVNRWSWCPNPHCGRVIKTEAKGTSGRCMNVDCECRLNVCNDCKQQNHWPATCEQTQAYRKLMHDRGDDKQVYLPTVLVRYMNCPSCNRPVEKVEGCNYVACLCNKAFCWACGGDWSKPPEGVEERHHYACVMKTRKKTALRHVPTPVTLEAAPPLYIQSVEHHRLLHRLARQDAKQQLNKLIERAMNSLRKAVPKFGYSSQVIQEARADYTELETCAMDVLNELHHCAEYTSVLLLYTKPKSLPAPKLIEQCLDKIQFFTLRFHQILKSDDRPATEMLDQLRHCYDLGQSAIYRLVTALKLNGLA